MATDVVTIPEEQGIETHGIERVSPKTRTHVNVVDNFTMWLSANLVISTVGLGALAIPIFRLGFWDSLAVIVILTTLVSIYGYRYVHRYERYAWIPMAVIFAIMLIVAAPHFSIVASSNTTTAAEIAGLLSFGGAVYGFATGWSSYAADYNVNQPEETPASRVFWLTFLRIFVPCVLLDTLGMAFTSYAPCSKVFSNVLLGNPRAVF